MKLLIKIALLTSICFQAMSASISGSNWMAGMAKDIAHIPLNKLYIPGSHDSATYYLENTFAKGQDYSEKINLLKPFGIGFAVMKIAKNWAMAQDRTIYQQLNDGIRYIDLRVIYRDSEKDFYCAHGLYGPKLSDVLSDMMRFMEENPQEIIIVQIGDLRYMGPENEKESNHKKLARMVQMALDKKLISKNDIEGPKAKVIDVWKKNKQVFLIHKNKDITREFDTFWPRSFIDDYWPNKDDPQALKQSIDNHMNKRQKDSNGNNFFVTQSQMTPSHETIKKALLPLGDRYRSLKDMAADVLRSLPQWLDDWRPRNPNIILLDFVNSNTAKHIYLLN